MPLVHYGFCRFRNFRKNFIFANSIKIHISATKARYINKRQSDFAIWRGLNFHEPSHMQSFVKIKSSRKFPNLQYLAVTLYKLISPFMCMAFLKAAIKRLSYVQYVTDKLFVVVACV